MYKELYVLVEGNDDERFVEWVLRPIFEDKYDYIGYYPYAQRPKRNVEKFIRSIASSNRTAEFFCLVDINSFPCVTARKQDIKEHKLGNVDDFRIQVVKREIESWYLAGLNEDCCRRLRIPVGSTTDNVNKEQFKQLLSTSKLGCTINCMIEMLKNYDLATAKLKNGSFDYFYRKYLE